MTPVTWAKIGLALFNLMKMAAYIIVYTQAKRAGKLEAAHEILVQATAKLKEMAEIAASPLSDEEVEQRLKDGTF